MALGTSKILKETTSGISKKRSVSILLLLIAFCIPVLLYLQTIGFGFTYFDDDFIIINNYALLSHFGNCHKAFITDAFIIKTSSFYRPVQTLSYMMDILLSGGNNAWMFHLSNIILLGIISSLLFILFRRFLIPPVLALFAVLIYCVHPLFVSSIAWIPARGDLLLLLFSLLSFLFFIEFLQKGKIQYLLLNWFAFSIALFCKETAAFIPFLFIIYYFTFSHNKRFEKKHLFIILLYIVSGIYWYWMRFQATHDAYEPNAEFGITAIMSNLRTIPEAIAKLFVSFGFAPFPGFSPFKTLTGSAVIVLIIILFFKNHGRTMKEKLFCISWFLILMLPPMIYKHPHIDYLDHRFFFPLIGILLFILFLFPPRWFEQNNIKIYGLLTAIFLVLCSFTFIKSRSYSDPITFYNTAVSKNPNSAITYYNRGVLWMARNDYKAASEDFSKAIILCPDYTEAYNSKGVANDNLGNLQEAVNDLNKAVSIRPDYAEAYNNKGSIMGSTGNYQEAMISFNKAIEINPKYLEAHINRVITEYKLKDFAAVLVDCNMIIQLNPHDEKAYQLKATAERELQKAGH
jgi:Tfp pilus assembly protein PilF